MNKYPKTGCLMITLLFLAGLFSIVMTGRGSKGYLDSAYQKDYESGGIEAGTILRLPIGSIVPTGRKFALIAFPTGRIDQARIIFSTAGTEVPAKPEFVSGEGLAVTYRMPGPDRQETFPLDNLESYPLRSDSSPKPVLESKTPAKAGAN